MNQKTTESTYTETQISDWRRYEKVRQSGRHNMFFPEARRATGLDSERYAFVLHHYTALKVQAESKA